jgi:hypothetical protein
VVGAGFHEDLSGRAEDRATKYESYRLARGLVRNVGGSEGGGAQKRLRFTQNIKLSLQ